MSQPSEQRETNWLVGWGATRLHARDEPDPKTENVMRPALCGTGVFYAPPTEWAAKRCASGRLPRCQVCERILAARQSTGSAVETPGNDGRNLLSSENVRLLCAMKERPRHKLVKVPGRKWVLSDGVRAPETTKYGRQMVATLRSKGWLQGPEDGPLSLATGAWTSP